MNQLSAILAAGHGKIPDRQRIRLVCSQWLSFGDIDLVISCCIDYNLRSGISNRALDSSRIGYVERLAIEAPHIPAPAFELAAELYSELAAAAKDNDFTIHSSAA